MPLLTRLCLRAGLGWLILALGAGLWLAISPGSAPPGLRPTWIHLITVGWITNLIFGVAHWMFPRASKEQPRGQVFWGWVAFGGLNAGLLLRALAESFPGPSAPALLEAAAVFQLGAGLAFAIHIWPRLTAR